MGKAPADQFYYGDWLRDIELQRSSACTKGVWMQTLANMWFANPRGELTETKEELTKLLMVKPDEFDNFLHEAETLGFCYTSRNSNGLITIRNRRMYREEKEREKNRLRQQRYYEKHKPNDTPNGKSDGDLTPPSSSSISSSTTKKKEIYKESVIFFDLFYKKYPRKIARDKCYKKWQGLFKRVNKENAQVLNDEIIVGLDRYVQYWIDNNTETEFIPHPLTWLNQGRWKDEVLDVKDKGYIAKAQDPDLKAQQERDEIDKQYTPKQLRNNKARLEAIIRGVAKKG